MNEFDELGEFNELTTNDIENMGSVEPIERPADSIEEPDDYYSSGISFTGESTCICAATITCSTWHA